MHRLVASAAYRIAFTYAAAFALAITLLGIAVYFAADADIRYQQNADIAQESAHLVREYNEGSLPDLRDAINKREAANRINAYGYAVFDLAGHRVAGSLDTSRPAAIGVHDISFVDPSEGADSALALTTQLPNNFRLVVAIDPETLERVDRMILLLFSGAFVLVVVLGIGGALIMGGYLRRRLGGISGTARAIISGDMGQRIPVSPRDDEFDQLALALNTMLDRIAQLLDNLRQVSSDVAHDLRTPLARLRNELEQALDGPRDLPAYRTGLKRAIGQSDHLLALFAAILRISEVEAGALKRTFAPVDLSDLVTDLCDSYAPAVHDNGRTLSCSAEPGIMLIGDRELLSQALINLLDNAQHHTPPGTQIAVLAEASDDWIRLSVADDGPGVAREDHARIVRRFARLDTSRATPGHGLGLNLVAAVSAAHGGALAIDENDPGLRVTMTLPRLPA
ncbi:sensor histidine kinase [Sphingomonas koreensis]|nr:sensor histidine kinase [Sphingomonas koreensis]